MIRTLALACLLLGAVGCSVAAEKTATPPDSRVAVTFVQPERFTDVKDSLLGSPRGTADLLAEIDRYLRTAGERYVPAGLTLNLQITNIDLAGDFEAWRGPQFDRVRIMRDIYPPRFALEFRLTDASGAVVKEGQRVLLDQLYLERRRAQQRRSSVLRQAAARRLAPPGVRVPPRQVRPK